MVNSSFLGVLGFMHQTLNNLGQVIIFGANDNIVNVLEVSGLTKWPNIGVVIKSI
jgi:anti-anti-sigma regulatory factor